MPARSKSQQRFFGIVHAIQKGTVDPEDVSDKAKDVADKIDYDDAYDFASTKHKNLPDKVKKKNKMSEKIREIVREEIINELNSIQYKRMESLVTMQALDAFNRAVRIIKKDLTEEEFDKKSIEAFLFDKVNKIVSRLG